MSDPAPEIAATEAPEATPAPKPTDTIEFWKQKAREQEGRAKSNADAAKRLQEIEDAQKSAEQRAAEAAARAQSDLQQARVEAARYKAAATHRIGEDYFDLLGSGSEDEILDRAQRLGSIVTERDHLQSEVGRLTAELAALQSGRPAQRPVEALRPGATPTDAPADDAYPANWLPQRRTNSS